MKEETTTKSLARSIAQLHVFQHKENIGITKVSIPNKFHQRHIIDVLFLLAVDGLPPVSAPLGSTGTTPSSVPYSPVDETRPNLKVPSLEAGLLHADPYLG